MRFVEQLVAANDRYFDLRVHARRYPTITPNGPSGVMRDRIERRANRELRKMKRAAGVNR